MQINKHYLKLEVIVAVCSLNFCSKLGFAFFQKEYAKKHWITIIIINNEINVAWILSATIFKKCPTWSLLSIGERKSNKQTNEIGIGKIKFSFLLNYINKWMGNYYFNKYIWFIYLWLLNEFLINELKFEFCSSKNW